jgi:hypothetical protein
MLKKKQKSGLMLVGIISPTPPKGENVANGVPNCDYHGAFQGYRN